MLMTFEVLKTRSEIEREKKFRVRFEIGFLKSELGEKETKNVF